MFSKVIEVLLSTPTALSDYQDELKQSIVKNLETKDTTVKIVTELSKDTHIVISLVDSHLGECDKTYYEKYQNREFRFLFYYFHDVEVEIDDFSDALFERIEFKSEVERDSKLYNSFDSIDDIKKSLEINLKESLSDLIRKTNYSKINARVINRSKGEKFYNNDNNMRKVDNFLRREKRISLINGLGGVGKTTLAIEYATDALREGIYDYAIWFDVENGIASEIKKFAIGYLLDDSEDGKKDNSYYERKFVDFLNEQPNSLVILDNLEYQDPYKKELKDFLNKHKRIDIIITSRQEIINLDIHPINLDVFKNENDGLEMFKLNSTRTYSLSEEQILKEIIKHLGNLPLALEITANFLSEFSEMKVSDYLEELKKGGLKLFSKIEEYNHLKSLQTTLRINASITKNENALKLLKIFSLISPEPIEKEIIEKYLMEQLEISDFDKALILKDLEKFFYIKVSDNGYSMHRLLQDAIVGEFFEENKEEQIELIRVVSLAIFWWFYNGVENYKYGSYFLKTVAQIEYILNHSEKLDIAESTIYLYSCLVSYYNNIGTNIKELLEYIDQILLFLNKVEIKTKEKVVVYIVCGNILTQDKQYDKAKEFLNKALEIVNDKKYEASIYHHIAQVYNNEKKHNKVEEFYLKSLEIKKELFGENSIKFSVTLNNLALCYENQNKYEKAEEYYLKSLTIDKKNFDMNHPRIAISYHNLGILYFNMHKYRESFNNIYNAIEGRLNSEMTIENKYKIKKYFNDIVGVRNKVPKIQEQSINKKIETLNRLLKEKGFKKLKLKKI